jgi:uncharacterized membrane protein
MSYEIYEPDAPTTRPRVRFETISEAWALFQQQAGVWLGAGAISIVALFLLVGGVGGISILPVLLASAGGKEPNMGAALGGMVVGIVGLVVLATLVGGLLSAGLYRMALKQVRGETLSVGDLFQVGDIFLSMLGMSLLVGLATSIAAQFFYIPGLILGGLWMLAGPLIADRKLGVIEAMSESWKALQHELVMATCYYLVISLVASLGSLLLGIGMIVTLPLFYLGLALVYRDFFPDRVSELN